MRREVLQGIVLHELVPVICADHEVCMSDWECEGAIFSMHGLKMPFLVLFLHGFLKVTLWFTDQQSPSDSIYAFIQPNTSSLAKQAVISASASSCPEAKLSQFGCSCNTSKERDERPQKLLWRRDALAALLHTTKPSGRSKFPKLFPRCLSSPSLLLLK